MQTAIYNEQFWPCFDRDARERSCVDFMWKLRHFVYTRTFWTFHRSFRLQMPSPLFEENRRRFHFATIPLYFCSIMRMSLLRCLIDVPRFSLLAQLIY